MTNLKSKTKKSTTNKIIVKADSNIANILKGKTRGYHQWYIRHILSNSSSYTIID